ncbi:hypothetical protein [Iamia sp.]|uniref:hypothetical protein n=1 Tax=Iamia sp. TaxID=2722710 RepID=UPI002B897326|nr:hypothetical protein [Iamia sp.]HXH55956.1 hypothetical protein [Iamia sp.]
MAGRGDVRVLDRVVDQGHGGVEVGRASASRNSWTTATGVSTAVWVVVSAIA